MVGGRHLPSKLVLALAALTATSGVVWATPVSGTPSPASGNLLSGDQASFANSTGGWVGHGATLSWVDSAGMGGGGALEMTPVGAPPVAGSGQSVSAWSSGAPGSSAPGTLTPASPGNDYSGSAQVEAADAAGATSQVDAALVFWNSTGSALSWAPGTATTVGDGAWSLTPAATAVAPPGSAYVSLLVMEWASTGSGQLYVDEPLLQDTSPPVPTFPDLLGGDQSTFASSTGGWIGHGATLGWASGVGMGGGGALVVTPAAGSSASAWSSGAPGSPSPGTLTPASPGLVYRGSAEVEGDDVAGATSQVDSALVFWSSTGSALGWVPAPLVAVGDGSWSLTPAATAVAPAGTADVSLLVMEWSTTGNGGLYVDDAVLQDTDPAVAAVTGPLHTSGTQVLDGNGNSVPLRGVAYTGLAETSAPSDLTESTFANLHHWGATMVRLFLNEDLWDPQSCAYDPNYQAAVEEAVGWVTSLGMVAQLTLQAGAPQDTGPTTQCSTGIFANVPDYPASDDFWTSVAGIFKSNPLVAFDLFNEPNAPSWPFWLEGGSGGWFQADGMQQLYDDVRSAGADNLVFAQGNNFANNPPPAGDLLSGSNVVYDVHYYTCPNTPPPSCSYQGNVYDPGLGLDPWVTFQQQEKVPVFIGEFGWPANSSGVYNNNVILFAHAQGWGWAAYTYDSWTGDPFDLVSSAGPAGPFVPSGAGMPVLWGTAAGL